MNRNHQNPYESPESSETKGSKRRLPVFTLIGVAVILVAAGATMVFMTGSAVSTKPELMLNRGPVPKRVIELRRSAPLEELKLETAAQESNQSTE